MCNIQVVVIVPSFITLRENCIKENIKKTVSIDACLIPEIVSLWEKGIHTTGCCCGHGKKEGIKYIGVEEKFIPRMKALGYKVSPNHNDLKREDSFYPKDMIY